MCGSIHCYTTTFVLCSYGRLCPDSYEGGMRRQFSILPDTFKSPPCLSDTNLLFSGIIPLLPSDSQKHPCSLPLFPTIPQVQLSSSLPYHLGRVPMLCNWTSAVQSKQNANQIHIPYYFIVATIKKVLPLTSWAGHTFSRLEGLKTITPSSAAAIRKSSVPDATPWQPSLPPSPEPFLSS